MKFWPFKKREPMTAWEAFEKYKAAKLRTRAASTIKSYEITLRHLERFLDRTPTIDDITDETIGKFLDMRLRLVAGRTANRDLVNLKALSVWLWKHNIIKQPIVDLEPFRAEKIVPCALTRDQVERLWDAAVKMEGKIGNVDANVFWLAVLQTFWDTGERFSAVLGIRKSDIDFGASTILCRAANRKGGREDALFEVSEKTIEAIEEMLEQRGNVRDNSLIFHLPFSQGKFWQYFGKLMQAASLPDDRRHKTHLLRRTVATHMAAAGGNATEQLRHSNPAITKANYIDPRIAKPPAAKDFLFQPGSNGEAL